jgi:predicted phosphodiesterase
LRARLDDEEPRVSAHREQDLGALRRVALLGGVYSNHLALQAALDIAAKRDVDAVIALGDFGGFGPHPDRAVALLRDHGVLAIQGNYEQSLAGGIDDCGCGYTDPRDNHYAQISYDYTRAHTAPEHVRWMAALPGHMRLTVAGQRVLLCHGSPRRVNEFLWSSTTPAPFIRRLLEEHDADVIACTHTGIHWQRFVEPGRGIVNVGALGRPANDGKTNVWMTILQSGEQGGKAEHVPVPYDHQRLAAEMRAEALPAEFVETILTGWWTTCLEILPARERGLGRN